MHQNLDPLEILGALLLFGLALLVLFYDGGIEPTLVRYPVAGLLVLWGIVTVWPTKAKRTSKTPVSRQLTYIGLLAVFMILIAALRPDFWS